MTQQSMELTLGGDKVRVDATAPQHVVAAQTMADCMFDIRTHKPDVILCAK